ncbi:MAG: glycosyltransferase family 1 protein [Lentisphaeria bacterium]
MASYIRSLLTALQAAAPPGLTLEVLLPRRDLSLLPLTHPGFTWRAYPDALAQPVVNIAWHNLGLPVLARGRYDLLHIPTYRRLPLLKSVPVVATVHDLAALSIPGKYDAARMFYNRRIVPALIRRADRVIAVSRCTRDDLRRFTGYPEDRLSVIYSGIDHARFRPVPKAEARAALAARHGLDRPYLAFVSRLEHPAKNHLRLIEAFAGYKAAHPGPLQLVLAGADWNGAAVIRAAAAASPAAADIRLTGFFPPEDLPALYSGCELMVYPSLFEGFGFPILEAMACGAPVICSGTTSMAEIAGEVAATFDPESVPAIAAALAAALARPWNEAEARRAGAYARTFDWAETARQVLAVYRAAAG